MTFERKVEVDWAGSVMEGKGTAKAGSGAFDLPVTFPARIGESGGKTSPEELMAAAHAACYAMALNATLGRKGASADRATRTCGSSTRRCRPNRGGRCWPGPRSASPAQPFNWPSRQGRSSF